MVSANEVLQAMLEEERKVTARLRKKLEEVKDRSALRIYKSAIERCAAERREFAIGQHEALLKVDQLTGRISELEREHAGWVRTANGYSVQLGETEAAAGRLSAENARLKETVAVLSEENNQRRDQRDEAQAENARLKEELVESRRIAEGQFDQAKAKSEENTRLGEERDALRDLYRSAETSNEQAIAENTRLLAMVRAVDCPECGRAMVWLDGEPGARVLGRHFRRSDSRELGSANEACRAVGRSVAELLAGSDKQTIRQLGVELKTGGGDAG